MYNFWHVLNLACRSKGQKICPKIKVLFDNFMLVINKNLSQKTKNTLHCITSSRFFLH